MNDAEAEKRYGFPRKPLQKKKLPKIYDGSAQYKTVFLRQIKKIIRVQLN